MDDVVPVVLQRLREADVVNLAGLADASLGQAYARGGHISTARRQGARLSGIVTLPESLSAMELMRLEQQASAINVIESSPISRFEVEVEVLRRDACQVVCTCGSATPLCVHGAALLYYWVNRSSAFVSLAIQQKAPVPVPPNGTTIPSSNMSYVLRDVPEPDLPSTPRYPPLPERNFTVNSISETVSQLGLSELRALAREYEITPAGMSKQPLMEALVEALSQPEAIRRVVGALEKPPRQLLAAFALAGGVMTDEELRGLFERFALDHAGSLQEMLVALQAKLLIVRTSFQHSLQTRLHYSFSPLDLRWYIPQEVREALHVTLPVAPFDITKAPVPTLLLAEPYKLLADMLLCVRVLDGLPVELLEHRPLRNSGSLSSSRLAADGSLALPPPEDQPAPAMIEKLQADVPRSPAFLRFVINLLTQADLLSQEEVWPAKLQAQSNAAQRLLGSDSDAMLHDLFERWLSQASYEELFELSELGVRVRCRATPLNQPALRRGELGRENSEARQELLTLLAQVPVDQWINFTSFARFIYRLHPTFLQRRQSLFPSPHWWVEQQEGRPLHPTQLSDWLRAEGRYLAYMLQGPLHWWGGCDLALSADEQLLAFRLTPLARLFFQGMPPDGLEQQVASNAPNLTISEEGHVLIPCQAANWPLLACIEDFAENTGVEHEQLSYRLTPSSLGEAMSRGHDPRDLLMLLTRFGPTPATPALSQLLSSLERRIAQYGRVRLYTDVSLLQTADASVMQQLYTLTSLKEQELRTLHPNLLLLKTQGVERLMEELKRRGQVPLLHKDG